MLTPPSFITITNSAPATRLEHQQALGRNRNAITTPRAHKIGQGLPAIFAAHQFLMMSHTINCDNHAYLFTSCAKFQLGYRSGSFGQGIPRDPTRRVRFTVYHLSRHPFLLLAGGGCVSNKVTTSQKLNWRKSQKRKHWPSQA